MPTKTRLANKTQWALLDIVAYSKRAKARWDKAMKMAERNMDPSMLILLAGMRDDMAAIEQLSKAALNGEYDQPGAGEQ